MSNSEKIKFTKRQLDYIKHMVEIEDSKEAVKQFAKIMTEEGLPPRDIIAVVETIMAAKK